MHPDHKCINNWFGFHMHTQCYMWKALTVQVLKSISSSTPTEEEDDGELA